MMRDQPEALTVTELTRQVRDLLESKIGQVWVKGEISNFRRQSSGHCYFTLKDEGAQVAAVLFRSATTHVSFQLVDGCQVLVFGEVTVYEAQGKYQIVVRQLLPCGLGELQARFEALKRKLQSEGLFDAARKKALPHYPSQVVIITSPTGAAIRDMLNVLSRRAPQLKIFIYPVRVQGQGAYLEITQAIHTLSRWYEDKIFQPDVLIVARGGGSLEDLWAFNEETVARALANCPIPTLSGIGHEIDFTIADFIVDLRAPTPSAAAEQLIQDRKKILQDVIQCHRRARRDIENRLKQARLHFYHLVQSAIFRESSRIVEGYYQRMDDLGERLQRAPALAAQEMRNRLEIKKVMLKERHPQRRISLLKSSLQQFHQRLSLLNPQRTLQRGYAIIKDEKGHIIRSIHRLSVGMRFDISLADGEIGAEVRTKSRLQKSSA